jgi:hypothetical protein
LVVIGQTTDTEPTSAKSERQWAKTRTQHLIRHNEAGRYYARDYRQGKEIWKTLGTTSYASAPKVLMFLQVLLPLFFPDRDPAAFPALAVRDSRCFNLLGVGHSRALVMMKESDRYFRYVLWSGVDQAWVGYCPDLFSDGDVCHSENRLEAFAHLCFLVDEHVEQLAVAGTALPEAKARVLVRAPQTQTTTQLVDPSAEIPQALPTGQNLDAAIQDNLEKQAQEAAEAQPYEGIAINLDSARAEAARLVKEALERKAKK